MLPKKLEQLVPQSVWATTEWNSFVDDDLNELPLDRIVLPQLETDMFVMVLTKTGCQFMAQPSPTAPGSSVNIVFNAINVGLLTTSELYAWREYPESREPSWENPWKLKPAPSQLETLQDRIDKLKRKLDSEDKQ